MLFLISNCNGRWISYFFQFRVPLSGKLVVRKQAIVVRYLAEKDARLSELFRKENTRVGFPFNEFLGCVVRAVLIKAK